MPACWLPQRTVKASLSVLETGSPTADRMWKLGIRRPQPTSSSLAEAALQQAGPLAAKMAGLDLPMKKSLLPWRNAGMPILPSRQTVGPHVMCLQPTAQGPASSHETIEMLGQCILNFMPVSLRRNKVVPHGSLGDRCVKSAKPQPQDVG